MSAKPIIIDASGLILGRLASYVAKYSLEGREIVIINAEKAVISGKRKSIVQEAKNILRTRTLGSQDKAPTHPRRADLYVRRVIRGMLPRRKSTGADAFKRIKVYIDVPEEFANKPTLKILEAESSRLKNKYIAVEDLSSEIGKM
ncbi:MAG: 50S ribosomal protein L13 [Candidatus Bathyarchaeota archaeon]|nr:50S ribosomal protein L13 [Candidatus Bathyarchaeota archaeon]